MLLKMLAETLNDFRNNLLVNVWRTFDTLNGWIARAVRERCYAENHDVAVCERIGKTAFDTAQSITPYVMLGSATFVGATAIKAFKQVHTGMCQRI